MKRYVTLVLVLILSMCCAVSFADTLSIDPSTATESEVTDMINTLSQLRVDMIRTRLAANPIQATDKDTYTFRNVPWYSTKAQAESIMSLSSSYARDNIYETIEVVKYPSTRYGEVEGNTGIDARYSKLMVAGYKAAMYAEFIYPIENGIIIRDPELAQLYMGYYWISDDDYTDIPAVYSDLETKLTGVYGSPIDATTEYHSIRKWVDGSGNTIVLIASRNMYDVAIAYIAAGADARVEEMKTAVHNEALQQEELERLNNSTNVDGL